MKGKRYVAGGVVVAGLFTTVVVHGAVTQLTAQAMMGGPFAGGPGGGPGMANPGMASPGQYQPGANPGAANPAMPGGAATPTPTAGDTQNQTPAAGTPARPAAPGKPVVSPSATTQPKPGTPAGQKPAQPKPTQTAKPAQPKPVQQKPAQPTQAPQPARPAQPQPQQPANGQKYKQYLGQAVSTQYGPVQVMIATDGVKIVGLRPVKAPQANEQQKQASIAAIKPINQQVMASNGQNVQVVSGATITSQAYIQSLRSAMAQAGLSA